MKYIAIANAKGGVGKTNIAAGIAIALAKLEAKVLLVDADLGLANVDVLLDLKPSATVKHVVCDGVDFVSAIVEGPFGISVVCGANGATELANPTTDHVNDLTSKVDRAAKDFDFVVYDTPSGINDATIALLEKVDRVVVVCTPDPTNVMDAYATVKALFEKKPNADVALLVNMADDVKSGNVVFGRFKSIIGQFLNKEVTFAGVICYDSAIKQATRNRASAVASNPKCKASKAIEEIADRITEPTVEQEESATLRLLQRARSAFSVLKKSKQPEESKEALKPAA